MVDKFKPPEKHSGKNVRSPLGEKTSIHQMQEQDKVRAMMGAQLKLDASFYTRLPEYKGMTFYWVNDEDANVEIQLDVGAQLVPRLSRGFNRQQGFAGRSETEHECRPAGTDSSNRAMNAYLMFLPEEDYQKYRIDPKEARNKLLMESMGMGKDPVDQKIQPHISGVKTYAPNNPVGNKKGFEQFHDA
jgi:hypothetical protein